MQKRSFLLGQQTKLKVKIRSILTYKGASLLLSMGSSPGKEGCGFETKVEFMDIFLQVMEPLRDENRLFRLEISQIATWAEDVRFLIRIPSRLLQRITGESRDR